MSSILRLERKQKNSSNAFRIRIFLLRSYSFGIETINAFKRSRSSFVSHTRFHTKMGKTMPFGATHTYMAYIGEHPSDINFGIKARLNEKTLLHLLLFDRYTDKRHVTISFAEISLVGAFILHFISH